MFKFFGLTTVKLTKSLSSFVFSILYREDSCEIPLSLNTVSFKLLRIHWLSSSMPAEDALEIFDN